MKNYIFYLLLGLYSNLTFGQSNNNGVLDTITEFSTIKTVQFTMPDGTLLETDVYLPIISDSVVVDLNGYTIQLIPKGTQLFVYDSLNGGLSSNEYQLPMVFTRTPYGKGDLDEFGVYLNVLGYAYCLQDMRGRYNSEGVYLPMYSDGWSKNEYHPTESNYLDITSANDPLNGNFHEDGKNSILFIMDSLKRDFDLDGDGVNETNANMYNGSIAMFGASALGNTQYQAASSIKNEVSQQGLKGLLPIVATNEHFNSIVQHNGVFRQALVQGWQTGQLLHNVDTIPTDTDVQNNVHSIFDYGNISGDEVIDNAVEFVTSIPDANGYTGMYPNYARRGDVSANFAPINSSGESDPNGQFNRYSNLELPMYHLTGWWDIFVDGQLETYQNIMDNTSLSTQQNQKIVIGPWTHASIGQTEVGDITFPESVFDLNIANISTIASGNTNSISISSVVEGEVVDWFRYLLNYESSNYIGEPKVKIPESDIWQAYGTADSVRVPSEDYYLTYAEFINYIAGFGGLEYLPVELKQDTLLFSIGISIPADTTLIQVGTQAVNSPVSPKVDFKEIPNVRYFVPGPVNDGVAENENVGNYWASSDVFPVVNNIKDYNLYFHSDGSLDTLPPQITEVPLTYEHDPNNPVETVGGGNLIIQTPQDDRVSAGPMNYTDPNFASFTMDRPDVLKFETDFIQDSLSIVGVPTAKIFASTSPLSGPSGVTDTDFFIRILDVYPNGEEFFVVEGAVNARARDYAKQLANGIEDVNIPYTNINENDVYEYEFRLLPIAYTFGHNHKLKVLISSSNWPRYQSNANVPVNDGDFFRRSPNDGLEYTYNSTAYAPRVAEQGIYFTPNQSSQITLPHFYKNWYADVEEKIEPKVTWFVYPNPAQTEFTVLTSTKENFEIELRTLTGQIIKSIAINQLNNYSTQHQVEVSDLASGIYVVNIVTANGIIKTEKLIKM